MQDSPQQRVVPLVCRGPMALSTAENFQRYARKFSRVAVREPEAFDTAPPEDCIRREATREHWEREFFD